MALLVALDGAKPDALILYEPIVLDLLRADDPDDGRARAWDRALIDRLAAGVAVGSPESGVAAFIEAYNEVQWTALPVKAREAIVADATAMRDLTTVVHHLPLDRAALGVSTALCWFFAAAARRKPRGAWPVVWPRCCRGLYWCASKRLAIWRLSLRRSGSLKKSRRSHASVMPAERPMPCYKR